ncbi:MAG: type III pantothenate kinase [Saprospiraceae bacterium]
MNLALDIGNTRTKSGIFEGNRLVEQAVWPDWTLDELLGYGTEAGANRVVFSSVAVHDPEMLRRMTEAFTVAMELTNEIPLPFRNAYRTPETLGKDRLAAVAGAQALFPGRNCMVVDCGTCIKYELLLGEGVYLGGNIAPGATMRLRAMHTFTARLPEAPMAMPDDAVGNSTETALQNGALRGAVLEIEGFARAYRERTGELTILLTGGDADFFKQHLNDPEIQVWPHLTLHGLNHILTYNATIHPTP